MQIKETLVVLDAADIDAESTFWSEVYGGTVIYDEDWHEIIVNDRAVMAIQLAPDHTPPNWPDGAPQQVHLDLHVDDLASAHAHVTALGARLLQEAVDPSAPAGFQVYTDPAGHPFCLCFG